MFNSTHTLVGLALARGGLDRWSLHAGWTAVIASNLPDIDIVAGLYDMPAYIEYHRGITHSFVGIPVLSIALAAGMFRFTGNFLRTFVIALLSMSAHLFLDYLNTYGVRPFLPFDGTWFYGDALFVIDPVFDAVLIAALVAGHFLQGRRRQLALIGLTVVALYVGLCLELRSLSRSHLAGFQKAEVSPTPLNPFQWIGLIDNPTDVSVVTITPFRGIVDTPQPFPKAPADEIVARAAASRSGKAFHGFARFPVTNVEARNSRFFVTFFDVRFFRGGRAFSAKIELDPSGRILDESLGFSLALD
jgi:inner membrane protein